MMQSHQSANLSMIPSMREDGGDHIRGVLRGFMKARALNVLSWTRKAGLPESTLRNYLKGTTRSLTFETLELLAAAEEIDVCTMLGAPTLTPDQRKAAEIVSQLPSDQAELWINMGLSLAGRPFPATTSRPSLSGTIHNGINPDNGNDAGGGEPRVTKKRAGRGSS